MSRRGAAVNGYVSPEVISAYEVLQDFWERYTAINNNLTEAVSTVEGFNNYYLGVKASAPILDNSGDPLQEGAMYWSSVETNLCVYDGTTWQQGSFSGDDIENNAIAIQETVDDALAYSIALG